jgi:signal transduction histidine kinase
MHLFKNSEIKRITLIFSGVLILFVIASFISTSIIINSYKTYFVNYNARILSVIIDKYPDIDQDIITEILNNKQITEEGKNSLNKYGISESTLVKSIDVLQSEYNTVLYTNLGLTTGLYALIIIVVFLFLWKLYKKISNLSEYTLNIKNGISTIDIIDNNEGELSILKNRLYDITRLLKENNELLEKDKIILKTAIADISHQLKTPLTSLYLCNEILTEEKDEHQRDVFLIKMHQELERMEWLITS